MPQGFVLGQILLLIYVTLSTLSLTETRADIFADDTTIGTVSHSKEGPVQSLTNDLQNVFILVQFYNSNNMSLKVSQTKLIYISSRHKQLYMTNDETPNNLSDSKLIPTSVENLLGVTIINSLCWDNHINQVLKNVILIYSCCQELIYF